MGTYGVVGLTALGSFVGAPLWTILVGACALVALAFHELRQLDQKYASAGTTQVWMMAASQSALHALLASSAAYALGSVARLTY